MEIAIITFVMIQVILLPIQAGLYMSTHLERKKNQYLYKTAIKRIRLLELNRGRY